MIFFDEQRHARFRVLIKRKLRLRGFDWKGPTTDYDSTKLLHFYIAIIKNNMKLIEIVEVK